MLCLDSIFSSGLVFPFGKTIRVFGKSDKNVRVNFHGILKEGIVENGSFSVEFPKEDVGGPYELTITNGIDEIALSDIYVGVVLVMAGQSNQQFKFGDGDDSYDDYEDISNIRLFTANHINFFDGDFEHFRAKDGWVSFKKEDLPFWPSLSYQAARFLNAQNKDVKIGIIAAYQGGSVIEAWIPEDDFARSGLDLDVKEKSEDHRDKFFRIWNRNGLLYDCICSQFAHFGCNLVCWYQGESDTSAKEGLIYDQELALLVKTWRNNLFDSDVPFIIVRIADLDCRNDEGWKSVQDAQERAAKIIPNSCLIDASPFCDTDTIHPIHKKELALRIGQKIKDILSI